MAKYNIFAHDNEMRTMSPKSALEACKSSHPLMLQYAQTNYRFTHWVKSNY